MHPVPDDKSSEHVDPIDTSIQRVDNERTYQHVGPWNSDGPVMLTAANRVSCALPPAEGRSRQEQDIFAGRRLQAYT